MKIKTLVFGCKELGLEERFKEKENIVFKTLDCAGSLTSVELLKVLEEGFQQVFVLACKKGICKGRIGNLRAEKRIETIKKFLGRWAEDYRIRFDYFSKEKEDALWKEVFKV
ncbi:hydrogenase iron-sulfur subunit [Thermodesulfobacterium sp. TA1]|uniref:hydrogenase iron-sulfur subunit n=1 Tax=Thermodesulfobacterium sp. TA1 TaxID=2234087 RepID=UPI001232A99F|nr:hydrogenase iron-sulfur subunit [Thermodesulfobacterium sp. TA1]QER42800.1 hydrogenase iron-sulfur subunit [Thermodesulfobacterium sp. TA1]